MNTSTRRTDVDQALARSRLTQAEYRQADNELNETVEQREVRNEKILGAVKANKKRLGAQLRRIELKIVLRELVLGIRAGIFRLVRFVRTWAWRLLLLSLAVLIGWLLFKWLFQAA